MNPSSSRSGPSQQPRGCEGEGCGSAIDTWPLHPTYSNGVRRHLCCSCIMLSERSYYCCSCFLLIPCPALWAPDDEFVALSAPITVCEVCQEAVAHLACLNPAPADGAGFICPACRAAAEGRPFTFAPPSGTRSDVRATRVLVVATKIALLLLQQDADRARAEAERLARNAAALRRAAYRALGAAGNIETETEMPSWNVNVQPVARSPRRSRNLRELGEGSQTRVNLLRRSKNRLELGSGSQTSVNPPPMARDGAASRRRSSNLTLRAAWDLNKEANASWNANVHPVARPQLSSQNLLEQGDGSQTGMNPPLMVRRQPRNAMPLPPLSALTIGSGSVTRLAVAATQAARGSIQPPRTVAAEARPSTPPTLQLFPDKASSSRTTPRTLQIFQDKMPGDEELK